MYVQGVFESGEPTTIANSSFFAGCDDAIDDNGAHLLLVGVWIDGWRHEGIAVSGFRSTSLPDGGGRVSVHHSVIRRCGQGFEVGYGSARGEIHASVVDSCNIGLRFGDNYLSRPAGAVLVASSITVTRSTFAPVLDFFIVLDGAANSLIVGDCAAGAGVHLAHGCLLCVVVAVVVVVVIAAFCALVFMSKAAQARDIATDTASYTTTSSFDDATGSCVVTSRGFRAFPLCTGRGAAHSSRTQLLEAWPRDAVGCAPTLVQRRARRKLNISQNVPEWAPDATRDAMSRRARLWRAAGWTAQYDDDEAVADALRSAWLSAVRCSGIRALRGVPRDTRVGRGR